MKSAIVLLVVLALSRISYARQAHDDAGSRPHTVRVFDEFDIESYSITVEANPESAPQETPDPEAPPSPTRLYGYGFFSGGSCNHGYKIIGGGGGGEAFPHRRLGIGGDGGYHQFSDGVTFGLYTLSVALHLGDSSANSRVDPFLSVSPGMYTSEDQGGFAFGLGGGVNFWFTGRVGLHTDLRFAALGTEEGIFLARVGVAFR
jgi:hypothetical protein